MVDAPTHREIDAKIDAVKAEVRADRIGLEGKIDRVLDAIGTLKERVHEDLETVRSDNKDTRRIIMVTFVVTVIAAIAALWTTQSNMLSAFQTGLAALSAVKK